MRELDFQAFLVQLFYLFKHYCDEEGGDKNLKTN